MIWGMGARRWIGEALCEVRCEMVRWWLGFGREGGGER